MKRHILKSFCGGFKGGKETAPTLPCVKMLNDSQSSLSPTALIFGLKYSQSSLAKISKLHLQ